MLATQADFRAERAQQQEGAEILLGLFSFDQKASIRFGYANGFLRTVTKRLAARASV
jgi:hypothetical protein